MCSYVPGEVLRQCSAANPADICVLSVRSLWRSFTYAQCHDCTDFIFHACIALKSLIYTAVCTPMCVLY